MRTEHPRTAADENAPARLVWSDDRLRRTHGAAGRAACEASINRDRAEEPAGAHDGDPVDEVPEEGVSRELQEGA